MNQWDYSFEPSPWEATVDTLRPGSVLSAARFLAMMETEPEEAVESAFDTLDTRDILLDIADLPVFCAEGETALRLSWEAALVKEGRLPQGLEENDPLRLYLEEIAMIPVCGDIQVLSQSLLSGDEYAGKKILDLMLGQVVEQACSLAGRGVLLLDLIQEGSLALWQAILDYNGGDLEAYCFRQMQKAMAKLLTLQARSSGVGQKMRQAMEDYRSVDERLLTDLGRNPTLEEIAQALHMTPEAAASVAEMINAAQLVSRVNKQSEAPVITPEDEQAVEDTAYFQTRQRIQELLSSLSGQEARILTLRFGLEGGLPLSPEDTGKRLGMSPDEVMKLETAALAKLRAEG
ncbi:MAG: sigma-70 family RNA polymerase sigma factor [Ruminococcaceae bacterium]|nr:sigma-70 family RNA polymerase sigma factor [Oscillospiraceae bacterium]